MVLRLLFSLENLLIVKWQASYGIKLQTEIHKQQSKV